MKLAPMLVHELANYMRGDVRNLSKTDMFTDVWTCPRFAIM